MSRTQAAVFTIALVLILDQVLKIYVKTHIHYGDGFSLLGLEWARIHFVENEGMAFGISIGGKIGKYILSIFRIVTVSVLVYILRNMIKTKESIGLIIFFSMVIAGAIGNIIDSMFYGMIFSESYFHGPIATLFPPEGGYGSFLTGKVVDMLYFPLYDGPLPAWVPFIGGKPFEFFKHVFNIADASISIGVVCILLFHRSILKNNKKEQTPESLQPIQDED
ncbi:MAG: lipoprotein signal peptidase [Saprospiraceae bacterium]